MSKAVNAFNIKDDLTELKQLGDMFGIGDALYNQVEKAVDDFAEAGDDWANLTAGDWYDSAPWATGNLRESISVDTSNLAKPAVFVDHQKLMSKAGQTLPAQREVYKKTGMTSITLPNSDYLEDAEEYAVSASMTTDPIEPHSAREYRIGEPRTPFLNSIWETLARKNRKVCFYGR